MKIFRGRSTELDILQKRIDTDDFQMVILYGRRRIGKTELINEFMRRQTCTCISFTSVEQSEKELLAAMTDTVLDTLAPDMKGLVNFPGFENLFDFIGQRAKKERILFFIDEYPYLARQCPYIQSVLQKVIDISWKHTNLFLILCGSLVAFMKDEVLGASAPLHGRCTVEMKLQPFHYLDTAAFIQNYTCEEKAIVYGLTNGVAKYIEQIDPEKTLRENIVSQYFSRGGYFTEEQVKTVISGDRQSPAIYNSIVSAIATGHTKNHEIAGYVGADDITYPLKVLTKSEIIERRVAKKPYYVLDDSMLTFWFRYVNKAISLIGSDKGQLYFDAEVNGKLHDFMGGVFEKMCRQYLFLHAGENDLPLVTEIENYQNTILIDGERKQIEIDLLGKNGKEILLVGECKFRNEKVDKETFEAFLDKVQVVHAKDTVLCIFSLAGFTEYVSTHAGKVRLISIEDMY